MKHPPETNLPSRNGVCNHFITKWPDINSHLARLICHSKVLPFSDCNPALVEIGRPIQFQLI